MSRCYNCEIELDSNNFSEEHIILNAAGGRLKSKGLLCNVCNSLFGNTYDNELATTTNDLVNLLQIKRHRGNPQPVKGIASKSNKEYHINYDGTLMSKTKFNQRKEGEKIHLNISAYDEEKFKEVLKQLKKKYPALNTDEIYESANRENKYLDDVLTIDTHVGGTNVFKSIAKTAVSYYIFSGGCRDNIKHILPYLRGEIELDIVWMHYPTLMPYLMEDDEVSHIISIRGNSKERILYAYIELFNAHNFIIKLNTEYDGNDLSIDYVYDLINQTELRNKLIDISYNRVQLNNLFENKDAKPFEMVQKRFSRILRIADKRQTSTQFKKLLTEAINKALNEYKDSKTLGQIELDEILKEITNNIAPFIAHLLNSRKGNR